MSTVREHLESLSNKRDEVYARCELFDGVNHLELSANRDFAFEAALALAVHLDEIRALVKDAESCAAMTSLLRLARAERDVALARLARSTNPEAQAAAEVGEPAEWRESPFGIEQWWLHSPSGLIVGNAGSSRMGGGPPYFASANGKALGEFITLEQAKVAAMQQQAKP